MRNLFVVILPSSIHDFRSVTSLLMHLGQTTIFPCSVGMFLFSLFLCFWRLVVLVLVVFKIYLHVHVDSNISLYSSCDIACPTHCSYSSKLIVCNFSFKTLHFLSVSAILAFLSRKSSSTYAMLKT